MKTSSKLLLFSSLSILLFVASCTTYYQKNLAFQEYFVQGNIIEADKTLDKNKRAAKNNNRLLYFFQKGITLQMLDQHQQSNDFLEQAYIYTEDYRKNYTKEAASILSNANAKPYTGEDHELVLLHYFKAMNFLQLNDYEAALVECRRINNKLNLLNDRYEKKKNRYKRDAFAMNLMGIVYEASGELNDAFIAYRNALEAYETDYTNNFGTNIPLQLKKDVLRTAYLNGFTDELQRLEQKYSMKHQPTTKTGGELIFFWHNGLGPVKDEWSINFLVVKGKGGAVTFVNEELGLSFPFPSIGESTGGLGDLKFVRVAFPKYLERKPYYRSGQISNGNQNFQLEMAENINDIAFKTLEDRMERELANALLRLALKQAVEQGVRSQNQNIGALLSVVNAVSEKADTRNWQTLPHSISYARIPLKEGNNSISLKTFSPKKSQNTEKNFSFNDVKKGQTIFQIYHNLESSPLDLTY